MSDTIEWFSGIDNYRKHTLTFGQDSNTFTLELLDVESRNVNTIHDAFEMHLSGANLPIEVLYSGGVDSECIIKVCLDRNIPVTAVTLRLLVSGAPINVRDLYYAEKFCREHNVQHNIVDLNIDKFYTNGDHIPYMDSYKFLRFPTASLLWLLEQCSSFPVIGGDYTWPQNNMENRLYSPHRHDHMCFDQYMRDKGITGIGNMISHSIDSNLMFINEHLRTYSDDPFYKHTLFNNLGLPLETRFRSFGWETIFQETEDTYRLASHLMGIHQNLSKRYGAMNSVIKWNKKFADTIGGEPGENDSYGIVHTYQGIEL
jgi:hypothetical protein